MTTSTQPLSTWRYWWELIRCHPGIYIATSILRIVIFAVGFQAWGLVTRWFFDSLTAPTSGHPAPLEWGPTAWAVVLIVTSLARSSLILVDMYVFFAWEFSSSVVMRKNMFERILDRPGARALPGSTGDAISRFREDPEEVGNFTAWALFIIAQLLFAIVAVVIMLRINQQITLVIFLPLAAVVVAANFTMSRVQKYREASRGATGLVTGFIGEMFNATQAIQLAGAEGAVLTHFQNLNDGRRKTALKDRLFSEVLGSIFRNTVNVGTGFILLLAGQSLRNGSFSVGDFALFVFYLGFISDLTAQVGLFFPRFKQAGVAFERMNRLLQGAPPITLVKKTASYLRGPLPAVPYTPKTAADRLETFSATNLTHLFPDSENGVRNIHLHLRRGSFTVITGRIGAGKTTLLRTLLGLLPKDAGEIRWNNQPVSNPAEFLVPPRVAYTAQIPALFSDSLRDNILLGLPETQVDLAYAIHAAVLEQDLLQLDHGLDTIVGPRGVKLSGGQKQRSAAARMFVRQPELLVFDDLSSALDVETERKLWERLFERHDATCLVVSHRRAALRRADHIIVIKDGAMVDEGGLNELLIRCEEMQWLWAGGEGVGYKYEL